MESGQLIEKGRRLRTKRCPTNLMNHPLSIKFKLYIYWSQYLHHGEGWLLWLNRHFFIIQNCFISSSKRPAYKGMILVSLLPMFTFVTPWYNVLSTSIHPFPTSHRNCCKIDRISSLPVVLESYVVHNSSKLFIFLFKDSRESNNSILIFYVTRTARSYWETISNLGIFNSPTKT
jgi:hypothetical protein